MPKERPIIFSGPMIRAILNGTKSQTRRVIKDPKGPWETGAPYPMRAITWYEGMSEKHPGHHQFYQSQDGLILYLRCPYGAVGDVLYVRETWATRREWDHIKPSGLPADADLWWRADKSSYRALNAKPGKWRPSIHMPKKFARIWLEITDDVRAERLQEIGAGDAIAEGIEPNGRDDIVDEVYRFGQLWNSLNAKRGYPWSGNWWVWAVEFAKV